MFLSHLPHLNNVVHKFIRVILCKPLSVFQGLYCIKFHTANNYYLIVLGAVNMATCDWYHPWCHYQHLMFQTNFLNYVLCWDSIFTNWTPYFHVCLFMIRKGFDKLMWFVCLFFMSFVWIPKFSNIQKKGVLCFCVVILYLGVAAFESGKCLYEGMHIVHIHFWFPLNPAIAGIFFYSGCLMLSFWCERQQRNFMAMSMGIYYCFVNIMGCMYGLLIYLYIFFCNLWTCWKFIY